MQAAKQLVLVDEFDREYKRLQRPVTAVAKTDHSLRLSNTLRNSSLADDRKVREYVGELHRYLNVDNRVPREKYPAKINWLSEPEPSTPRQAPRRQREPASASPVQQARKKRRGKRRLLQWAQYGPQR